MGGADDPAGFRRGRHRLCGDPQQQAGDAGSLGCQGQLAAGDQIERPGLAPDLQHHDPQCLAGQGVCRCPQGGFRILRAHRHQETRIKTEFGDAAHSERAGFPFGEILTNPQPGPAWGQTSGQPRDKACGRGSLSPLGEYLMHHPGCEPALQHRIGFGMAEANPVRTKGIARRFHAGDLVAQGRKRATARTGHARLLRKEFWLLGEPEPGPFVHDMF